ncbi:Ig-like domain repeat protein [Methanobrevibacter sp.]
MLITVLTFLFLGNVCAEDISGANQTLETDSEVSQEILSETPDELQTAGQKINVSIKFNPRYGAEGKDVFITPDVTYNGTKISGNITFYKDYNRTDYVTNMSTKGGYLKFPMNETLNNVNYWPLYYTFTADDGRYDDDTDNYNYFINVDSNSIFLTGNGKTGSFDADEIILKVSAKYYKASQASSLLHVFVNGTEVGTFTSINSTYTISSGKYKGKIDVYVKYDGYINASTEKDYYAAAESNHLIINLAPFDLSFTNTTYGNVTANITMPYAGICELTINSKPYGQPIRFTQAGSRLVKITGVPASTAPYTVKATIQGTSNAKERNLTITKATSKLTISSIKGNNTSVSDIHSFSVSVEGRGKITTNFSSKEFNVNETVVLNNSLLKPGRNTISVKYSGDENYTASGADIVLKLFSNTTVTLKANNMTPKYGQIISLTPTVVSDANAILKNGTITYYIKDTSISKALSPSEVFNFTVDRSAPFNITAKYSGFEDYMPADGTVEIKAQKADNNVNLMIQNMTYGENINVIISNAADGLYTVHIGQHNISVKVTNKTGQNNTAKPNLPVANNYKANLTYENKNYQTTGTAAFSVTPAKNDVTLSISNATYGEPLKVSITNAADGLYTVHIGQHNISVRVTNKTGQNNTAKPNLPVANNYKANLTYENKNYQTTGTAAFSVTPAINNITLFIDDISYRENLTVEISNAVPGDYVVSIEDKKITVKVGDGRTGKTSAFVDLKIKNDYTATASLENPNYITNASTKFSVYQCRSIVEIISCNNITYPSDLVAEINITNRTFATYEIADGSGNIVRMGIADSNNITVKGLNAGNYTLTVKNQGNENVSNASASKTFTVAKLDTQIYSNDEVYNSTVTITVYVDEDATGFVELEIAGKKYYVPVEKSDMWQGIAEFSHDFAPGIYFAKIRYLGDANFNPAEDEVQFTIVKENKTLNKTKVEVDVEVKDNNVSITMSVNRDATGLIEVNIDGQLAYLPIKNGKAILNVVMPQGHYGVLATYLGDEHYESSFGTKVFNVYGHVKQNTTVKALPQVDENRVILTVTLNENATGFVEITISGNKYYVPVNKGKATFTNIFPAGTYTANVTYLGDGNFNTANDKAQFTVINQTPVLQNTSISTDVECNDNDVTITVEVDESATGLIEVNIDGDSAYLPVDNGQVIYEVILPAGNYTVTSTYLGDAGFNPNSTSDTFIVTGIIMENTTLDISYEINGTDAIITIKSNAEGEVSVYVDGEENKVKLENGTATLKVPSLDYGEHSLVAIFEGDENNKPAENATTMYIEAFATKFVNVTVGKHDLTATLVTATGDPLANETVTVNVDGNEYNATTDENGIITVEDAIGKLIELSYPGKDAFQPTDMEINLKETNPEKQNTTLDISYELNGTDATITIKSNAEGEVSVYVDSEENKVKLENGTATLKVPSLDYGEHSVVAIFEGDENNKPAENATTIYLEAIATKFANITIDKNVLSAYLVTATGDPLANKSITVLIDNKEYGEKTNAEGMVDIEEVLNSIVELKYEGEGAFMPTSVEINLKNLAPEREVTEIMSKDFEQYACDFYEGERGGNFTFRLIDSKGNPIANETIYIGYNGVTYNRTTDKNGYANVQINLKNAGLYTFAVVYLGSDNYEGALAVHKITINKKATSITAPAKTYKVATKTKKYTVTLKTSKHSSADGKTYLAKGKKIVLKVNGKTYTAKTNAKGQATFKITNLKKKGKFTAAIKFAGDNTYKASSKKAILTVK